MLADMDAFETSCVHERVMVMVDGGGAGAGAGTHQVEGGHESEGRVLGVEKSGGENVGVEDVETMLDVAKGRHGEICRILEDACRSVAM